jgi:hypothetical protein
MSLPVLNADDDFLILSAVGSPETANKIIALLNAAGSDVSGPGSSTANALARYADTSGSLLANSGVLVDGSNNITGVNSLNGVTSTTISYLDATSSIQTQLNNRLQLSGGTLTGRLLIPNGSNAAPSLSFSADTNTGLSRSGSGEISLVGGGNFLVIANSTAITFNSPLAAASQTLQTPAAGVLTLTNGPGASTGNPTIYLTLKINGTNYVFPGWSF